MSKEQQQQKQVRFAVEFKNPQETFVKHFTEKLDGEPQDNLLQIVRSMKSDKSLSHDADDLAQFKGMITCLEVMISGRKKIYIKAEIVAANKAVKDIEKKDFADLNLDLSGEGKKLQGIENLESIAAFVGETMREHGPKNFPEWVIDQTRFVLAKAVETALRQAQPSDEDSASAASSMQAVAGVKLSEVGAISRGGRS